MKCRWTVSEDEAVARIGTVKPRPVEEEIEHRQAQAERWAGKARRWDREGTASLTSSAQPRAPPTTQRAEAPRDKKRKSGIHLAPQPPFNPEIAAGTRNKKGKKKTRSSGNKEGHCWRWSSDAPKPAPSLAALASPRRLLVASLEACMGVPC